MRTFFRALLLVLAPAAAGAAHVALAQQPPAPSTPEATVPVPPKVTVEGVPPIPTSIADALARYADFRSAQFVGWNPVKRQIVVSTRLDNVPQLYVVEGPGKAPMPITTEKDGISTNVWAQFDPADANTLVYRRDAQKGTEAYNLYKYDVSSGATTLLTDGKSRYSAPPLAKPVWSRQGKYLAYDSTERNGRDRDVYVMDVSDPRTAHRIVEADGIWVPEDWSPDGKSLLVTQIVFSGSETYVWRVDVKTGERRRLTPEDEKSYWDHPRFSADGRNVFAVSTRGNGNSRLWRAAVSGGGWQPITKESDAVWTFELSPDGEKAAILYDRGSTDDLQVIDLGTLKARPLGAIPAGLIDGVTWRPGSQEVAFSLQNVRTPGDVFSVDASLGTLTRWTTSRVGAFNPDTLPPPEVVSWKSFDVRAITGILYRPAAKFAGPRPVIVNIHGGPFDRARPIFVGRSNFFLNELGIAIIYPNYRGSVGFGAEFASLDDGMKREAAIKDIGGLLDWIATKPEFDRNRVMLTGASYGGYLALEAGIVYTDRVRCVYEGAGATNLVTFLEETAPARQDDRRKEFGDERDPQTRAFLLSISPITRAKEMKKPLGIAHPGNDTRVPVDQARALVQAVKDNGVPVWYMEYGEVGHDDFPKTLQNYNFNFACWIQFVKSYLVN
jgi:dipeptidyl aminopeptidase/acylaminoacyl peptidase